MRHPSFAAAALAAVLFPWLAGCGQLSPSGAASVATGYVSHQLCSWVFVAGQDPQTAYHSAIEPVAGSMAPFFGSTLDREAGEVRASFAGLAESRAVYRPPYGCLNETGLPLRGEPAGLVRRAAADGAPGPAMLLPPIAGPEPVPAVNSGLEAALAHAFEEAPRAPYRHTQAVVVLHRDRIVAERYAGGVGVDTALPGWSATKSMTNALLGILVRQGRLDMQAPAPVAAWSDPADPRHAITPDQLLRMTSGLDVGQSLRDVSPFDPAARMLFVAHDMAAFAERAPLAHAPGSRWNYSDENTILLSRMVRDAAGGDAAGTLDFARRELFDKLGMRHVVLEFDAAGTPIGSSHMWAPARDWARLGLLYLHDGVVGGERILPAGWVEASARPTPGSEDYGYGAGFWTNRGAGEGARYRIAAGIPADAFMARGSQGQYVLIVPSRELVIVRLGPAFTPRDDMDAVARLARESIAALDDEAGSADTAPDSPAPGSASLAR